MTYAPDNLVYFGLDLVGFFLSYQQGERVDIRLNAVHSFKILGEAFFSLLVFVQQCNNFGAPDVFCFIEVFES